MKKFLLYDYSLESWILRDDYYAGGKAIKNYNTPWLNKAREQAISDRLTAKLANPCSYYDIQCGSNTF